MASAEGGRSGMTASAASLTRRATAGPTSAPAASIRSRSQGDGCAGQDERQSLCCLQSGARAPVVRAR